MTTPLLKTKLHIPAARPELVSRPRLIEQLNAYTHRKLTLVSAPAGFGKTTLLSGWARQSGLSAAWLSLDESDNELTLFLIYLIAALQTVEARVGKRALSILRSPQPTPVEVVLTALINDIAAIPARALLVLDDYHMIEAPPIHDALTFLLRHLPPTIHLVIATRVDPPLPLARLRARDQLTELRAADLRFSPPEAADFLNRVMDLGLAAEDIATLEARTEGWIAGLQMAAISLRGQKDATGFIKSFTGSHRFVLDYLIEEVLEQQSEAIQTFLLQTAVLERLTGSLCDAVRFGTGQRPESPGSSEEAAVGQDGAKSPPRENSGQAILATLERANLFVTRLDEERRWYRYHELFADLLRHRLRQTQPEQLPTLHRRASEWYEQHGFPDEAIEHALRADDSQRAASLIEEHFGATYQRGEHSKLRRWLAGLPVEVVCSKPHLCIFHAWDLFTSGQLAAAERRLQAAELGLAEWDLPPGPERMRIQGMVAAIRAYLAYYRGDASGTIHWARQALDYLPRQDLTWRSTAAIALGDGYSIRGEIAAAHQARSDALAISKETGDTYLSTIASLKLAVTLRQQGHLRRVIEICESQYSLAGESGLSQTVVVGWLQAIWGEVLAELNELDRAIDQAGQGVELTERGRDVAMVGWSNSCLIRVLFSRGDMAGAIKVIRKLENLARRRDVPPWITERVAAWQARIWLAEGKPDAASQWVQERKLDAYGGPLLLHKMQYRVLARVLIAQGRRDEAGRLLERLLETAEAGGQTSRAIEILILQALAFQSGGDETQAMTSLERALILAEPGGFVRTFVDEGPAMAQLLYEAAALGIMPDYAGKLLAAFGDRTKAQPQTAGAIPSSLVARGSSPALSLSRPSRRDLVEELIEPLSERELEVLQLIAEGLTNREIAARFFLSLNTVKAHTRNIYGKLDVHSRTQAVARARATGLLPSG